MALRDLVGVEGCLDVVEAEPARRAEAPPVAVVVAVDASAARLVAHLNSEQKKAQTTNIGDAKHGGGGRGGAF